ncbi:YhcN/YlaJ family sporulation lipoprotein [Fictibacillus sp. Mic-4]|uniref:YhcN/YlaJ family sporulation lipoprotein n=1 Tax=Fictibacillus TaxID=1329200 RepID=UPI0003F95371|nr:YhcN/YlaJ family sporulation lipoprotein [Fictibacillus gelatini]
MFVRYKRIAFVMLLFMFALLSACRSGQDASRQELRNQSDRQNVTYNDDQPHKQRAYVKNKTNMQVADDAAENVANLPEVHTANVIVTDNNAYVAAVLEGGKKLTKDLEKKMADEVKKADPTINNVYVSTNPDFVNHMKRYAKDIREGRPISGFVNEFSKMVQRLFPNAR